MSVQVTAMITQAGTLAFDRLDEAPRLGLVGKNEISAMRMNCKTQILSWVFVEGLLPEVLRI